ncbi:beta-ketoacyl-ACP synthase III [Alkalimarinus alittae]|uniref:Beta-ketoacyl-ACP synthase III n=1 Tax=Alkalimarinus alittae TaxID=2961619 RepID=A0ABY6N6U9_9ALTE|nr:beta-ketoacyl-ACP synthase III [Alkalimarinus alittae]UZE97816.1 beta-ketoacyl-ACP synthase III [Alkalimarinus alittae]
MIKAAISGTGLYTPPEKISNEELVEAFNQYVANFNKQHASDISDGTVEPLQASSAAFIEKASGIKNRRVINKSGILDPERMAPYIAERRDDEPSIQCDMAVLAANEALEQSGKTVADIDAVIVACSNMPRAYPALSVEVQSRMGIDGFAYDMNVACSSATFGLQAAVNAVENGTARAVLVISPEICTAHLNFRDRDSHFIFGDACTAIVVEQMATASSNDVYEVVGTKLKTVFSNNIRNNFGFLNRCDEAGVGKADKLFVQQGRKVFKDVVPMVASIIGDHLKENNLAPEQLKRMWLHQANLSMNKLISKKVMGREATSLEAPVILDEYANTSSAGSVIAYHKYKGDIEKGDIGVICSFGAGYSVGSVLLRKC